MAQSVQKKNSILPMVPVYLTSPHRAAHLVQDGRRLILLVRHGQTDWNQAKRLQGREDIPLNESGRRQACRIAELFRRTSLYGIRYGSIFASPLHRAADTARYIGAALANPAVPYTDCEIPENGAPQIIDRLIERDYGSLAGLTLEERRRRFPGGEAQAGDVESVPQSAARMYKAFDDLLEAADERAVIAVTHGGIINAVFSRLTKGEIGTGRTLTVNCSVSMVAAGIGSPIPLAYNLQEQSIVEYLHKMLLAGADI